MKRHKNNRTNLKRFALIILVIVVIFNIPTAKAEINNTIPTTSVLNQQLIVLLKQIITLLMQQVEVLTKQLTVQQQSIDNLNNTAFQSTPTPTQSITSTTSDFIEQQPISSYFVAEISSDKDAVKNDGFDRATLTIITKLNNGQVIPNKEVKINNLVYTSNKDGTIVYLTQPTKIPLYDCDGKLGSFVITIIFDGKVYLKSIGIINVQPFEKYKSGLPPACS